MAFTCKAPTARPSVAARSQRIVASALPKPARKQLAAVLMAAPLLFAGGAMAVDTTEETKAGYQGVIPPGPNYATEQQKELNVVPDAVEEIKQQNKEASGDLDVPPPGTK